MFHLMDANMCQRIWLIFVRDGTLKTFKNVCPTMEDYAFILCQVLETMFRQNFE